MQILYSSLVVMHLLELGIDLRLVEPAVAEAVGRGTAPRFEVLIPWLRLSCETIAPDSFRVIHAAAAGFAPVIEGAEEARGGAPSA